MITVIIVDMGVKGIVKVMKGSGEYMTEKRLSDEEIECVLTPLSILAHMGFKCVTKDGEDLTEDLKKVCKGDYE